jgi:hypothetical protein
MTKRKKNGAPDANQRSVCGGEERGTSRPKEAGAKTEVSFFCDLVAEAMSNGIKAITSDFGSEDLGSIPG